MPPPSRPAVLLACLGLLAAGPGAAASAAAPVAGPAAPLFHGNWCGPGDVGRRAPVDALDAACRAHDLCYERRGRGACSCDRAFLRATAALSQSRRIGESARSMAAMANTFFALAPCIEAVKTPRRPRKR